MKNVLKYSVAALFAAALAFSCQKNLEDEFVQDETAVSGKMMTVTCSIDTPEEAPSSKVTLTNESSKGKTRWEMTDEVLFHGKYVGKPNYSCVVSPSSISADGKTASFTIPELDGEYDGSGDGYVSSLFAVYPASAIYDFSDGANWRYVQAFKETNHLLLVGYNKPTSEDTDRSHFKFINLSGALSFKVNKGDLGFDEYKVMGNNSEVVGYSKYTVTAAYCTGGWAEHRTNYTGSSGPGGTSGPLTVLDITPTDPNWANGTTVNTVFFPNGVNFASGFTILFLKDGVEVKRVSTNTAKNIAIGKYLDLGDITSHLFTYVPPATHNSSIDLTGATQIDAGGNANCYVVNAGDASNQNKVFRFKAYKGNGTAGVGTIASVSVLWETYNNDTEPTAKSVIAAVDYDKQAANDYYEIVFKMPEALHAGNALIAAKDSGGNILWSWHIWVPANMFTTGTYGISSQTLMSRNLGALVDTEAEETTVDARSFGLIYQWGRKDPFLGSKRFNSSSQALIAGTAKSETTSKYTIAQSIANPTTYVAIKGDWMTPEDATLWTEGGDKSIYDPCPPGYRVPSKVSSDPLWSNVTTLDSSYGWEPNSTYGWWKLGTAVFPFAGYIDYSGGDVAHAYDRTRIWNAHKSTTDYAYDQQIWYESGAWKSEPSWQHRTACGNSVRCVAE